MRANWRRDWEEHASQELPVDVLPASNGEYVPPPPTAEQLAIMDLADRESDRWRRRLGMDRRTFVRSAAAMAVGFWAIDAVGGGRFGRYARANNTATTDACDLEWAAGEGLETLQNLPGEFVFDVQSHHVDPEGMWRVTNPAFHVAFAALWPQATSGGRPALRDDGTVRGPGAGEIDPINNLSRFHYLKELFLDSATTMTVLSSVPTAPDDRNPLPLAEAAATVHTVNQLAGSQRSVMHAFVMPNRGSAGNGTDGYGLTPVHLAEELELMEQRAQQHTDILRGWKVYCPWGDVPNASGWFLDSEHVGLPFLQHVVDLSGRYGIPPVVATHKGFALPGFDQRAASPQDVGPAARAFPQLKFLVYHSGHDIGEGPQQPYPGDDAVPPDSRRVDALIRSARVNGVAATDAAGHPAGQFGANSPNVYAELGSVWRDYLSDPDSCAHLLGKLITHIGPRRVVWGTDSLWYGSPHREIVALRRFTFSQEAKDLYGLPHGLDGDIDDPQALATDPARTIRNGILGRNAAEAYGIDPDAARHAISCDQVNGLRESYIADPLTERERAPLASNQVLGARTPAELAADRKEQPWAP